MNEVTHRDRYGRELVYLAVTALAAAALAGALALGVGQAGTDPSNGVLTGPIRWDLPVAFVGGSAQGTSPLR